MRKQRITIALIVAAAFVAVSATFGARAHDGQHVASQELRGTWAINFIVGPSPKGNVFGQPHRHKFEFRDEDGQRTVTAKEVLDIIVPGSWRAASDEFSATFEFTCPQGVICGTVIMRGKVDSDTRISGRVAIFWDEQDSNTPTGFDTVTGTFTGERCGGIRTAHDTGGCETP